MGKKFKSTKDFDILVDVKDGFILMEAKGYIAKYPVNELDNALFMHNKITTEKTLKQIETYLKELINPKPEQLSLF